MEKKLLFVFDFKYPETFLMGSGLWAAIELLQQDFAIEKINIAVEKPHETLSDFVLGWGAFNSRVDRMLQTLPSDIPKGLCIAGNSFPPDGMEKYNVLFHETMFGKEQIKNHPHTVHAFGVNTDIYWGHSSVKIWDYLTVGAFASWKRQNLLIKKTGTRFAIGEIQKGNISESMNIIAELLLEGIGISDMVMPENLAKIYKLAKVVYIPANSNGGGERAVLEARACRIPVEVESDNPKLIELTKSPLWDQWYYMEQLKKGISNYV